MKDAEMPAAEAREKAEKLLEKSKTVWVATNGSHGGHPNVRAMTPSLVEGSARMWFCTSLDSGKIIELIKDNKATIYGYSPRNLAEFRLWGTVEILDDHESRRHAWREDFKEHFPEGADDPNMRVLRFEASNGFYRGPGGKSGGFSI